MRQILIVIVFALAVVGVNAKDKKKVVIALGDSTYKVQVDSLMLHGDKEYYEKDNPNKAMKYYLQAYELGGVDAALMLGMYYSTSLFQGVRDRGLNYWKEASAVGHSDSAYMLGSYYLEDEMDLKEGLSWMEVADSLGSSDAAYYLARLYTEGRNVEQNDSIGFLYYVKAADRGVVEAQHFVGIEYLEGARMQRNKKYALKYLTMAAEQGFSQSAYLAGLCYEKGWGVPTPDYVSAAYYYMIAADAEMPLAQYRLSLLYSEGKGVDKNPQRAEYWLEQSKKSKLSDDAMEWSDLYSKHLNKQK